MNKYRLFTIAIFAVAALPVFAQNPTDIHLSARFIQADGTRANVVYLADATGTIGGQYSQIAGASSDAWGYRDGTADRADHVYFGWGGGVARHNADGSGGVLMFGNANAPNGNYRALAFDPTGNGGAGSFWSANFGSSLVEVDMAGNLLNTFANGGYSVYGLSYDDATGNLWGHDRIASGAQVIEISTATGGIIGGGWNSTFGLLQGNGDPALNGGLSAYRAGGGYVLAGVLQGAPDSGFTADTAGNLVGPFSPNLRDFEGQTANPGHLGIASPVPEPASMIALGLGVAALVARRRRKKAA